MCIRDRGNTAGLGLFSIRERLLHIGGDMRIVSNKDGPTVSLLAPLKIKISDLREEDETR